jgi:hypothetical protein
MTKFALSLSYILLYIAKRKAMALPASPIAEVETEKCPVR